MTDKEAIVQRIGGRLFDVMRSNGVAVTQTQIAIGHSASSCTLATLSDGSQISVRPDRANADDAVLLRAGMYEPGVGTWLSCEISVDSAGKTSARFDSSGAPEWPLTVPGPAFFERELKTLPRDDAHIPDWFRAGFDGTPRPE